MSDREMNLRVNANSPDTRPVTHFHLSPDLRIRKTRQNLLRGPCRIVSACVPFPSKWGFRPLDL